MSGFDEIVDFIVVGSGGGSMCASLYMLSKGKQVVMLEKSDLVGGTTARSGGVMWIPNNRFLKRDGIEDSYEKALTYLDGLRAEISRRWAPKRWILVDFSQGGLTIARWLARRQHHWDRVVLWAAIVPGDVSVEGFQRGMAGRELELVLGDRDEFLTPERLAQARGRYDGLGVPWRLHRYDGRHEVTPDAFAQVLS